jgi:hypothetical protein
MEDAARTKTDQYNNSIEACMMLTLCGSLAHKSVSDPSHRVVISFRRVIVFVRPGLVAKLVRLNESNKFGKTKKGSEIIERLSSGRIRLDIMVSQGS